LKPTSTHPLSAEEAPNDKVIDNRLTAIEARAEFEYRFKERLGMMAPDGNPTAQQQGFAQCEAMREVGLLSETLINSQKS
jgi:hypothetical protein